MSLLELLEFCAELNFDAIDPTGYFFRVSEGSDRQVPQ